ncbi:hypothetical protein FVP60_09845 [Microbacterium mitrae]|uniref:Uncharacterized protein n=1 Tax=Microbacterium mitrae TaxID=664640 RepID=A0A5C8HN04_9MICO|nr:hypothetical protein [Microbacterium mitrae]TXK04062.1 hypothetical protein FVP60_09845 [Microbacterium mitrae]
MNRASATRRRFVAPGTMGFRGSRWVALREWVALGGRVALIAWSRIALRSGNAPTCADEVAPSS